MINHIYVCIFSLFGGVALIGSPVTGYVRLAGDTAITNSGTNSPTVTDADGDTIAASFSSITLTDGQSLSLTGSVNFTLTRSLGNNQFRIGLFDGPNAITADSGTDFVGIYSGLATSGTSSIFSSDGIEAIPFVSGGSTNLNGNTNLYTGAAVTSGQDVDFELTLTRSGNNLDIRTRYSSATSAVNIDETISNITGLGFTYDSVAFLFGGALNATSATLNNVQVSLIMASADPADPADPGVSQDYNSAIRLFGIDFNKNDALSAPTQSLCRVIAGASNSALNASTYSKRIGSLAVTVSQPDGMRFEFLGANSDSSREIPGGDISRSFMVADFIATRQGLLELMVTGLPEGDYLFRSFHLDTSMSSNLGFAQGVDATTPNTILASVEGVLLDLVQPTNLGSAGLGDTFIRDEQVPFIGFALRHDGSGPVSIELRARHPNGGTNFLLLNGFEFFKVAP